MTWWRACGVAILAAIHALPATAQGSRSVTTETIIVPADPEMTPDDPGESSGDSALPAAPETPPTDVPEVFYDPEILPPAVRRLREQIMAAATSGDPESLRPIIEANGQPPVFSFGSVEDPVAYLVSLSGDAGGREILAILLEVLEAGFVRVEEENEGEVYVWPYFARYPVESLTPQQMVELFKLVYAGDYEDMLAYGYYLSYRLGIGADGTWRYFIAGD